MKIYTKKGDSGTTSLLGGTRVHKNHARIEAYGTLDELNSFLGLLRDYSPENNEESLLLLEIQERLFTIGSHLACDPEHQKMILPDLNESAIEKLELSIDAQESKLPELKNFILPGGHPANSIAHICRCVCRRAERLVVSLSINESVEALILSYLNRLSDWLFVYARTLTRFYNAPEIVWQTRNNK
jgi:cob(I)alamin adenosyltransferase